MNIKNVVSIYGNRIEVDELGYIKEYDSTGKLIYYKNSYDEKNDNKHIISLFGKNIKLSKESYQALKKQFKED